VRRTRTHEPAGGGRCFAIRVTSCATHAASRKWLSGSLTQLFGHELLAAYSGLLILLDRPPDGGVLALLTDPLSCKPLCKALTGTGRPAFYCTVHKYLRSLTAYRGAATCADATFVYLPDDPTSTLKTRLTSG
jgi:hypothetical protein